MNLFKKITLAFAMFLLMSSVMNLSTGSPVVYKEPSMLDELKTIELADHLPIDGVKDNLWWN